MYTNQVQVRHPPHVGSLVRAGESKQFIWTVPHVQLRFKPSPYHVKGSFSFVVYFSFPSPSLYLLKYYYWESGDSAAG